MAKKQNTHHPSSFARATEDRLSPLQGGRKKWDLARLLKPRSICVVGGREAARVIEQCRLMEFPGAIYAVHPTRPELEGIPCFPNVQDLPEAPDATFIGVNRELTVDVVRSLAARGAGGAVCYASGFSESGEDGEILQTALLEAAKGMPVIGPNCYGLINYLDGVPLWPDQHGGRRVDRGVAILSQSSNIAITLTMNRRAVPLAAVATLGNRAQVGAPAMMEAMLDDSRITAIGILIETLDDAADLASAAEKAREKRVPVVAFKLGQSEDGASATLSHTASLAGTDAAVSAFLNGLGIARAPSIPAFLETLKLLHIAGPLAGRDVASLSCSGGEAALVADALARRRLNARPLTEIERARVAETLNDLVTVSNPLDYHTFNWGDPDRLTVTFSAMLACGFDMSLLVIDLPRGDRCGDADWHTTLESFAAACDQAGARGGVLATLPESLTEQLAQDLLARGIVPLAGIDDGLAALEAAADIGEAWTAPPPRLDGLRPLNPCSEITLDEWEAKQRLAQAGVPVPRGEIVSALRDVMSATERVGKPAVVKSVGPGLTHKTEKDAVRLNLRGTPEIVAAAGSLMPLGDKLLIEQMVEDGVAEVIVGVRRDPQVGLTLLLGSGGELVELVEDRTLLLLPASRPEIESVISQLKVGALIAGFRGRPEGDLTALVDTILAIQQFALENVGSLIELDVNPVIVRTEGNGAVAVDALMRLAEGDPT